MLGFLDMIGLGSKPAAEDETSDGPSANWERSVKSDDLAEGGRQCLRLESGRGVLLVRHEGIVHCLDHSCYHRAAPLVHGDIEDLEGQSYIICPLHDYKISLTTGEALAKKKLPGEPVVRLISKGFHQRIHHVHEGSEPPKGVSFTGGTDSWIWVRETTPAAVREVVHTASLAGTTSAEAPAPEAEGSSASEAAASSDADVRAGVETATTLGFKALRVAAKAEGEAGGPATTALAAARLDRAKLVRHEAPPKGWLKSDDCAHLVY